MEKKKVIWIMAVTVLLAIGTAQAVECPEQIPGLVSYWKFDEGAGTTAYDTVSSNDGAVLSAEWTAGQIVGALEFYGNSERVNCGKDSSLYMGDSITLCAWIKPNEKTAIGRIFSRGYYSNSSNNKYILASYYYDTGMFHYKIRHDNNPKEIFAPGSVGVWQHVAVTYDSGTMQLHVNGELVSSISGADLQPAVSNYDLMIGVSVAPYPSSTSFDGAIDDVAFFNRALTSDEVMRIYLEGMEGYGLSLDHKMIAVNEVKNAIDVKNEAIEVVNAAIRKEQTSLAALEALRECDDPGLNPQNILRAIQRIQQSIGRQENIKTELQKSIRSLNIALRQLGCPLGNCD